MSKSEIVTNKRVLLNSPGINISDIYYTDASTRVTDKETMPIQGRFQSSLILNWGSTSNIQIPNSGNILHQVFLHIQIPALQTNEFINRGFLYNCIESLTWTLGSSTQSQLKYDQKSIFQMAMSMMNTEEYRSMALIVAGDEHVNPTVNPIDATLILPLPWSSLRASEDEGKKGIDTGLLSSNINLQITLSSADKIYGGSASPHPVGPLQCFVYTREEVLTNKADSIRTELMNNSTQIYSYPFIHRSSPTPRQVTIGTQQTVNLQELLESDLQAITFTAHLDQDRDNTGGFAPNVLLGLQCRDIELLYNGQTVWKAPGRSARLIPSLYDGGASSIKHSRIRRDSTLSGVATDEVDMYVYYIPFSSMFKKNINYQGAYSNSPRFANQTFQLRLTVLNPPQVTGFDGAFIHFTYYYSAVAELSSGVSTITFA